MIGVWSSITAITQVLVHSGKFSILEPHFLGGSLEIATLTHVSILDTKGGTIKYLTTNKSSWLFKG